jgi:hypothetical protein
MTPVQAYSTDAWPVNDGRCCDDYNENVVVPALLLRGAAAEKKAKREGNGGS